MASVSQTRRYYTGEHSYGVDAQRRIALPAAWRGASDSDRAFMLLPHEQPCIHMMPRALFDKLAPRLEEELLANPLAVVALGSLAGASSEVVVDKQGRFALTPALMAHAGITDRVLMVGTAFSITLWSPEVWEARRQGGAEASRVMSAAAVRPDRLGQAFRDAMGVPSQG